MVTNLSDDYKEIVLPTIPEFNPNPKLAKEKSETEVVSLCCYLKSLIFICILTTEEEEEICKEGREYRREQRR